MSQVLLWASFAVSVLVSCYVLLPRLLGRKANTTTVPGDSTPTAPNTVLQYVAYATPLVGLLATLPTQGFFSKGQQLGIGFLIGGIAAILAQTLLAKGEQKENIAAPMLSLAGVYSLGIIATTLPLLFLHASLLDALMGVAVGWFCTAFVSLMALPGSTRQSALGRYTAVGIGFTVTLIAAAELAIFRDEVTQQLPKLTWVSLLVALAAFSNLLLTGCVLFVPRMRGAAKWLMPLLVLIGGGGVTFFETVSKATGDVRLAVIGIGGLLLWPVAFAVQREAARRAGTLAPPLLAVVLVTSGFLAALQTLQGVGAGAVILALFLAYPATTLLLPETGDAEPEERSRFSLTMPGLLLFGTVLVLWRLAATRWEDTLQGVALTDQYALFGLMVGICLPQLVGTIAGRWQGGTTGKTVGGVLTLGVQALLCVLAPTVVLVLFGPKSEPSLLIGLAIGAIPALAGNLSLLSSLVAVAVALFLGQFTGHLVPEDTPTRVEKIRLLVLLMVVLVTTTITAERLTALRRDKET